MNENFISTLPPDHIGALVQEACSNAIALATTISKLPPYFLLNHPQRRRIAEAGAYLADILQEAHGTCSCPASRRVPPAMADSLEAFSDAYGEINGR